MIEISEQIGEVICTIIKNNIFTTDYPSAIINIVMKNINFKIGFKIKREKLDEYIRLHTSFYSLFLSDLHTCVNIKMKSTNHSHEQLDFVIMKSKEEIEMKKIPFSLYSQYYDYNKKLHKDKYHTFLVFYSGSVILSSSGPETEEVYREFFNIIKENRDLFIDDTQ